MNFDAIVIGSGQAGNPLSAVLAEHGWTVAQIEKSHLGGTCINTGCTPTKTMVASAQVAYYARNAARWGVLTDNVRVDLPAILARKNKIVQSFRSNQQRRIDQHPKIRLFRGQAHFLPRARYRSATISSKAAAFSSMPARVLACPHLQGVESVGALTNESLMELRELPEHLIVLGGGYIGLEFGQMFHRFGSRVTIVNRAPQILSREDDDVARELYKTLEAEGIVFRMNATSPKVAKNGVEIVLAVEVGGKMETIRGSHLLNATGRRPNTETLDLDKAGVPLDSHGYIKVNGRLETDVPGIWALGDIKGGPAFTHIAYNDYQVVFGNLIEGKNLTVENRYLPYALFTDPQLGRVGITERDARASGRKLKMGTNAMSHVARAIERDETAGFMKIIVDGETDRILGAAILGTEGGELIQILGAMMLAGAPYTVLKGAVYIHPTLAEGFFGLMEAVKPVS